MIEGRYFQPRSARFSPARLSRPEKRMLRLEGQDGALIGEFRLKRVRIRERLGNIPRRFRFPDGGMFETMDNDGADALLAGTGRGASTLDRLERSLRWVALSVVIVVAAIYGFAAYGIPLLADELARVTPPNVITFIAQQSLKTLDGRVLSPTTLKPEQKAKAQAILEKAAKHGHLPLKTYRLVFRNAPHVGPNAFALPDGEIVVTDQLFPLIKSDSELEGVLAHEIAHVDRRHGLQSIYQASLVPAAIAVMTGDASQFGQLATLLPGILLQSSYRRSFEQQADDDAAETLKANGEDPASLAHLLLRLDAKVCGKTGCGPSWLSSHPATIDRVNRLMGERKP
ncbi:MAG TPA: M48 family metallopeptidase [Rhizomicrobium sp.]|jgi:Zn-dependent protease with chaperone function